MPLGTARWIDGLIRAWRVEASGNSMADGASAEAAAARYRGAAVALRRAGGLAAAHVDGAERASSFPMAC